MLFCWQVRLLVLCNQWPPLSLKTNHKHSLSKLSALFCSVLLCFQFNLDPIHLPRAASNFSLWSILSFSGGGTHIKSSSISSPQIPFSILFLINSTLVFVQVCGHGFCVEFEISVLDLIELAHKVLF